MIKSLNGGDFIHNLRAILALFFSELVPLYSLMRG